MQLGFNEFGSIPVTFEQFSFDPRINAQIKAVGFVTPTPIQEQAIPVVLEGHDVMGLAQTGTGKTAAFMLPILQRLTQGPLKRTRVLVVAPTRELAEQIYQTTIDLGRQTRVGSVAIYGGVSKKRQIDALKRGVEIVIACPGRLLDLVNDGVVNLKHVEVLVLDEADRMCDMGFLPDIRRIISLLPKKRQTLFFSATMPKDIRQLADQFLYKPVTVQIGRIRTAVTVSHAFYPVKQGLKKKHLWAMLEQVPTGRVLIFTRTKHRARGLAKDLVKRNYPAAALQGNMSQNQRQRSINGFKDGSINILVATDIAARGIDVSEISHVINFDIPDTVDAYTHRIGRTGRAEQEGEAFTFITDEDTQMVRQIERRLGQTIERRQLPDFDYDEVVVRQIQAPRQPRQPRQQSNRNRGGGQQGGRGQQGGGRRRRGSSNGQRNKTA